VRTLCGCVDECVNAKGHRKEKHKIPRNPRPAAAEEDKENSGAAAPIPVLGESGSGKTQTILGRSSKVGGWAFCGRTPCLLVWLRRRTLEEAQSGQSTGAQGGTRVCLLGEYEFNGI
jgi:hypothetical protein